MRRVLLLPRLLNPFPSLLLPVITAIDALFTQPSSFPRLVEPLKVLLPSRVFVGRLHLVECVADRCPFHASEWIAGGGRKRRNRRAWTHALFSIRLRSECPSIFLGNGTGREGERVDWSLLAIFFCSFPCCGLHVFAFSVFPSGVHVVCFLVCVWFWTLLFHFSLISLFPPYFLFCPRLSTSLLHFSDFLRFLFLVPSGFYSFAFPSCSFSLGATHPTCTSFIFCLLVLIFHFLSYCSWKAKENEKASCHFNSSVGKFLEDSCGWSVSLFLSFFLCVLSIWVWKTKTMKTKSKMHLPFLFGQVFGRQLLMVCCSLSLSLPVLSVGLLSSFFASFCSVGCRVSAHWCVLLPGCLHPIPFLLCFESFLCASVPLLLSVSQCMCLGFFSTFWPCVLFVFH